MKLSPGEFLGFTTSTVFIIVICAVVFEGWQSLDSTWRIVIGLSVLIPACGMFTAFGILKLIAMYRVDTAPPEKKRVTRGKS